MCVHWPCRAGCASWVGKRGFWRRCPPPLSAPGEASRAAGTRQLAAREVVRGAWIGVHATAGGVAGSARGRRATPHRLGVEARPLVTIASQFRRFRHLRMACGRVCSWRGARGVAGEAGAARQRAGRRCARRCSGVAGAPARGRVRPFDGRREPISALQTPAQRSCGRAWSRWGARGVAGEAGAAWRPERRHCARRGSEGAGAPA